MLCAAASLVCACGSSSSKAPDAGGDAAADAPGDGPQCAGGGAVTVRGPVVPSSSQLTLAVTSHDATGALCNVVTGGSGSDAQMTIDAPPGGMVSMIVDESAGGRHVMTWTEVQPGDTLVFPWARRDVTMKTVEVAMTIPALLGASQYDVSLQCGHGAGLDVRRFAAGEFVQAVPCRSDAQNMTAMVSADNGGEVKFAVSAITPIEPSGPTTLALGAWLQAPLVTATVHGASAFDGVSATFVPFPATEEPSTSFVVFGAPSDGDPVVLGPQAVPPTWTLEVLVGLSSGSLSSWPPRLLQLGRVQTQPASIDLAVATDFLPSIDAELAVGLPRPQVTWSLARPANADAVFINAENWVMVTRAQPGTVRFPELPQNLLPTGPASLREVDVIDVAGITSFDQLRRDPLQAYARADQSLSSWGLFPNYIEP
jgi:hypothetical protein